MNLFQKIKQGFKKTKENFLNKVKKILVKTKITPELWQDLEESLILSDISYETAESIINNMKEIVKINNLKEADQLMNILKSEIYSIVNITQKKESDKNPKVKLIIGVNGTGKTTTIAKLANLYIKENKKVILGASDTFRAGAIQQLNIWADKLNIKMVKHQEGSDPSAVAYDTVSSAIARSYDIAIIDTAGRLHVKENLMRELQKTYKVIQKLIEREQLEVILVLDATIGKNALSQVKTFSQFLPIDSIILTKLDSTAKGGIIITIAKEFALPIKYITFGETIEKIAKFDPEAFTDAIFEKN